MPTRQLIGRNYRVIEVITQYHMTEIKLAVCIDSVYVYGGLQGTTSRWRANGWVTTQGLVTNVDLWMLVMDLLDLATPLLLLA